MNTAEFHLNQEVYFFSLVHNRPTIQSGFIKRLEATSRNGRVMVTVGGLANRDDILIQIEMDGHQKDVFSDKITLRTNPTEAYLDGVYRMGKEFATNMALLERIFTEIVEKNSTTKTE